MDVRNQTSSKNRRGTLRRAPRGNVRFVCRKGALGLGPNILARVGNVSERGGCLHLKAAVAVKDEVEVSLEGYGVGTTNRLGTVVWLRPHNDGTYLVGVQFQKSLTFAEIQGIARP